MRTPRAPDDAAGEPGHEPPATLSAPREPEPEPELATTDRTVDAPPHASDPAAAPPARIGRYLVIALLGHGGMGVVFEAFDPELDRRVAIKLLRPERARDGSQLRLLREAQAMARLSHPHVVQVYDVGVDGDRVFIAMELVRGCTISQWLGQQPRAWPEIVRHFVDAGKGLRAAHEVGVIHRDFKPYNVLVGDDGRVRVADFGLAGAEDGPPPVAPSGPSGPGSTSYLAASLTATGAVLGTPRYMAPEQHAGVEVGPAADQFAFCVALHEAIFGGHPFECDSNQALAVNVIEGHYLPPDDTSVAPKWLAEAIRRGLQPDPADRHPTMDALIGRLEREPSRRRRRWIGGLAAVVGLAGIAAAWYGLVEASPCTGGEAEIAEVWSPARRDAIDAALADDGGGTTVARQVIRTLDAYAEAWADTHRTVCLQHRDEAMSSSTFDAAMGCLQRHRAALDGVIETVATGEQQVIERAIGAATSLPAMAHCRDRQRLALDVRPPDDPRDAAAATALRQRLARAEAVHDAGDLDAAMEELASIEREVDALGHAPLRAEQELVSARLAMDREDWPQAQPELAAALLDALASGVDLVAAEAAVRAVFVDVMVLGPERYDPHDEAIARALVDRLQAPPSLAALLANNVGVVRAMQGDKQAGARAFAHALAFADDADDVDPVDHCGYVINLAISTPDPVARDALFARALQLAEDSLGPGHERILEISMLRARQTVDPEQARTRFGPACARARARLPVQWSRCHLCHWWLAELDDELGATDDARTALAETLRCLDHAPPEIDDEYVAALRAKSHGFDAVLRGDAADALAELDAAERWLAPQRELPWIAVELADVAVLRARSLVALGRGAEAVAPLGSAIESYEAAMTTIEDRSLQQRRARAQRLLDLLRP